MRITVFTPTYNRADKLGNLYHSLQAQTFFDFEWLIVDDGSTDNTKEVVDQWMQEGNLFSIRYFFAENKGKMKEMNLAMDLAQGELFFTVDSDDMLVPGALQTIDRWERKMPHDGTFCGLAGNAEYLDKHCINPMFSEGFIDATLFQRYRDNGKEHIGYDRAWVFYTDIYRRYKFPEFEGEKFIAEAVSWNRMANDGWKIRCFNDVLSVYIQHEGGLTDTMSKILTNSPKGYGLWKAEMIRFLCYPIQRRIREYYVFYCDLSATHSWQQIAELIEAPKILMWMLHLYNLTKHGGKKK